MRIKALYQACTEYFEMAIENPETELHYTTPFELLIAVILSAQCTDKRINIVTPGLFAAFPDAHAMAKAQESEIFELIKSVTFPNNKSKNLLKTTTLLSEKFNGTVPLDFDELVKLPGVGRKTANVIISVLNNSPAMAVDTHVFRVSQRIGLVKPSKTPLQVEMQLMKNIPTLLVPKYHHWLILHGRRTCTARSPKCKECGLVTVCKYKLKNLAEEK